MFVVANVVDDHVYYLLKLMLTLMRILIKEDSSLTCWEMVAIIDCSMLTMKNITKNSVCRALLRCGSRITLQKIQYVGHCFDVDPASFNETATSAMCWCLYTLKTQYRDDPSPIIRILCCLMRWNVGLSSLFWNKARKCSLEDLVIATIQEDSSGWIHWECDTQFFFFLTNVESFINLWSDPLVKDKNEPSIPSVIVKFWKHCSHIALKKRPELNKKSILHHDNICLHTSNKTIVFLTKHETEVMEHPPYSPVVASCNLWLFPFYAWNLCFEDQDSTPIKQLVQCQILTSILSIWERLSKCGWSGGWDGTNILCHVALFWKRVYSLINFWSHRFLQG